MGGAEGGSGVGCRLAEVIRSIRWKYRAKMGMFLVFADGEL